MSLLDKEIDLIKETWTPVSKDKKSAGVLLFKLFFTKHPEYISLFNEFDDLNLDDLINHKKLVSHALRVVNAISGIVDMLDDDSKSTIIIERLSELARSHLKRQIDVEKFRNLGAVLIDFLKQMNSGHSEEDAMVSSWSKLYGVIVNIVEKEGVYELGVEDGC